MSDLSLKGRVDLETTGLTGGAALAKKALRDLASASTASGAQMTATQRATAKAVVDSFAKMKKAGSDAVDNAITVERKLLEAERNGKTARAATRAATETTKVSGAAQASFFMAKKTNEVIKGGVMLEEAEGRKQQTALQNELALRKQIFMEQQALNREQEQAAGNLTAMRYTLYSVGTGLAIAGAGMLALSTASIGVAVEWQRDFANVQRTVGGSKTEIDNLRASFVNLAQTIPESFSQLTEIGTLAGQMGIKGTANIVGFTRTIAQFTATTGVTIDTAATAFGRLNSLLPDVKGNFTKLADSVLKVGVNSVATEAQILRITTQLASIAGPVGYTSTQIIGLSGALASIAVPPELSRGVFTRVFGKITSAINEGGVSMERWGRIANMSGQQFKQEWSSDASGTFVKLMSGMREQGTGLATSLAAVGITSVRDVPILQRLGGALSSTGKVGGLLAESLDNAATAGGTMKEQYGIIADSISSKLQVLQNNIQALMDAAGSNALGVFGFVLSSINEKLKAFTDFANTPFGSVVAVIGGVVTAVAGVLTLIGSAAAIGLAGYIALTQALVGLSGSAGGAAISLGGLNVMLAETGTIGAVAAGTIRMVGVAMKALAAITLVLALPDIANFFNDTMYKVKGFKTDFTSTLKRATDEGFYNLGKGALQAAASMDDFARGAARASANVGFGSAAFQDIKRLDDGMAGLIASGSYDEFAAKMNKMSEKTGLSQKDIMKSLEETQKVMDNGEIHLKKMSDGTFRLTNNTGNLTTATTEYEDALTATEQAQTDFLKTVSDADAGFVTLGGALKTTQDAQQATAQATADASKSVTDTWQTYYDGKSVTTKGFIANLQAEVDAQKSWESDLSSLAGKVSSNTLSELAKLGPEGAPLIHALTTASKSELDKITSLYSQGGIDAAAAYAASLMTAQTILVTSLSNIGSKSRAAFLKEVSDGRLPFVEILRKYGLDAEGNPIKGKFELDTVTAEKNLADSVARMSRLRVFIYTDYKIGDVAPAPKVPSFVTPPGYKAPKRQIGTKGYPKYPFTGGMMFDGGGYTGDGGMYKPAGIVHKGEFVFTKQATANLGVNYLYNLMRAGKKGYATGGTVAASSNSYVPSYGGPANQRNSTANAHSTTIVELSPVDRQLLADAGNLQFVIPGVHIAKAVSANNVKSASRRNA